MISGGLLAAVIVLAALVCPLTMWLGRRGIGRGCALCARQDRGETVERLRAKQEQLSRQLAALESCRADVSARVEDTTGAG